MRVLGLILVMCLLTLNRISLDVVAKTGCVFLTVVLFGIASIYIGLFTATEFDLYASEGEEGISGLSANNFSDNWEPKYVDGSFFLYLSIYFPSVTGKFKKLC